MTEGVCFSGCFLFMIPVLQQVEFEEVQKINITGEQTSCVLLYLTLLVNLRKIHNQSVFHNFKPPSALADKTCYHLFR